MLTSFTVASDTDRWDEFKIVLKYGTAYLVHGTTIFPRAHRTPSDINVAVENIYSFTFQESRADFFFFLNKVALKAISPLAS